MQASTFGMIWGIIGGLVGGTIGAIYGGPAGAATGWSIGYTVGNLEGTYILGTLFPDKPHIYFPPPVKPHENRFQTSTWGTAIPLQFGCGRMAGNVVYMSEIVETLLSESHRQDGVRYYIKTKLYTCTLVVAFCEPIENIARIWLNRKVFADYRNPLSPLYPTGDNERAYVNWETSIARSEIYFSIHLGGETQAPDAALAAILGAADTPAYRGVTYIVFPDFPIGEFQGLPTVEIEANPVPHGNLLIHDTSAHKLYCMTGLTGAVASELAFGYPWPVGFPAGSQLTQFNAITPAGDLAKLWYNSSWSYRVYVFVGLSTTVRYYFEIGSDMIVEGFACEPTTGRFICTGNVGATRGVFRIYEPDGTFVTSWTDTAWPLQPYNHGGATIVGFLQNPAAPTQPGNMVCVYRNAYLVYYQGYDILYVYPSYLGGARLYPTGSYYKVGPITHNDASPTSQPYSQMYFIPARLTSDYLWAIHSNRQGYYKFRLSDLVELPPSNVQRVQLPASTYYPLSPPHDASPAPVSGMCMTNGFEG